MPNWVLQYETRLVRYGVYLGGTYQIRLRYLGLIKTSPVTLGFTLPTISFASRYCTNNRLLCPIENLINNPRCCETFLITESGGNDLDSARGAMVDFGDVTGALVRFK